MPLNRALLGKEYDPSEFEVTAEATMMYARAYNDDNPAFLDESRPGGIVAPPMFAVVYVGPAMIVPCFDPELGVNFDRLVHGEQDMTWLAPVRSGDKLVGRGRIAAIEDKGTGELLTVAWESKNQKGEVVVKGTSSFFIRGEKKSGAGKKDDVPKTEAVAPPAIVVKASMQVSEDQTYRYADASGDHNAIHVNPDFAKMVGLPGIILQGLCTMAFTSKAILDGRLGRDPAKLRRLAVRFRKPVLPGDVVTTEAWPAGERAGLEVLNFHARNQKGEDVIVNGVAECAA